MRLKPMTALLLQCLLVPLTACAGHTQIQTKLTQVSIPQSVLNCPDSPNPPGPDGTQKTVAAYIVELVEVWDDCHAKLEAVRNILHE